MRPTLICSIGGLTILAVGIVAGMSYLSSRAMVGSLASGMINLGLGRLEQAVRREFDALTDQVGYVERAIAKGDYGFGDPEKLAVFLRGSLAAAPQIDGVIVAGADNEAVLAVREERGGPAETRNLTIRPESGLGQLAKRAQASEKSFWREPRFLSRRKATVLGLCQPLHVGGTYRGFIVAGLFSNTLSEFARDLGRPGRFEAFILFGRDRVLAHPNLVKGAPDVSEKTPLLVPEKVGDPVLARIAHARPRSDTDLKLRDGAEALVVDVSGTEHQIFMKRVDGYGDVPLYVGAHFVETRIDRVVRSLRNQSLTGLGMLLAALVLAVILSRTIAQPIRRAARGVSRIQALDFEDVEPLPRSRLKEIDDLAVSFNSMLGGLKSFGRYVPRSLVTRLVRENRVGAGSEERELTVMFTDMADFSARCEAMTAKEVADFINGHFAEIARCIEDEGGTIDKYIGDAVMAFWGAPDTLDNTAEPACRAARLLPAFAEIDAATRDLLAPRRQSSALTVSLLPTLAQRWLIPRLGSFQDRHRSIEVRFSATAALADLQRDDIDLAIRFGEGRWPGCDATFLMSNDMFPVIAPRLHARQPVERIGDLARHVLLRVDAEPRTDDWPVWLEAAGAPPLEPRSWLSFESSAQALAAAAAGIGVAIGHRPFVMDDLSAGRLVQPFEPIVESAQAYYAVTASGKPQAARVEAFLDWLIMEAGALRGAEAEAP